MLRIAFLLLFAADLHAAVPSVDIDTAAQVYEDAATRVQVRASLGTMPAHIRKLFEGNTSSALNDAQLAAVTAAAKRGFRIDVFEAPALAAFAANLDPVTVKKSEAFFLSDVGKRMVAADVAVATLEEAQIDKIMNGGLTAASTPARDALFDKIERAERSTESTVQIFLNMGSAVALGTAIGSGMDPGPVEDRARKSGEASRAALERDMHKPLLRYLAYGYRDLSDADLKRILVFFESSAGKRYVAANIALLGAGFDAMGKRCGEQLGESFRELAQAQIATERADSAERP
jgi:Uncharacterized protein conserved in bacteria (DUF2059)